MVYGSGFRAEPTIGKPDALYWVAAREHELNCYNKETLLFTIGYDIPIPW